MAHGISTRTLFCKSTNVVGLKLAAQERLHALLRAACSKGMKLHGRVVEEHGVESSLRG